MLNKVIIMGRLTADPELRQTPNNIDNCRFTIACDRDFAAKGEEKQADFVTVTTWRKTAEFVSKYFKKGSMIIVEGSLRTGSYTDKKYNDVKHYTTEVFADVVRFGESKKTEQQATAANAPAPENINFGEFEEVISNVDLPF